jgi:hypothetical protein
MSPEEQAARYEQYVRENWDSLTSFEQEQARQYMQAKAQASQAAAQPQGQYGSAYGQPAFGAQPGFGGSAWTHQPGFPSAQPGEAQPGFGASAGVYNTMDPAQAKAFLYSDPIYGGYGTGAFGPRREEQPNGWAVPVGYVGLLLFTPLAIICGILNLSAGRTGHGMAQLILSVLPIVVLVMMIAAAP